MILSRCFGFPVEDGLFEPAIQILKNEFGLVDGIGEPVSGDYRVLVWEDTQGIGRYRVHCHGDLDWNSLTGNHNLYDMFNFHYWSGRNRFDHEVFIQDPMKEALARIIGLSQNRFEADHLYYKCSVEELEKRLGLQ